MNIDIALVSLSIFFFLLTLVITGVKYRRGDYKKDAAR